MDWITVLIMLPLAALCWWAGFVATKRMRLAKNREREALAQSIREKKIQEKQEQREES